MPVTARLSSRFYKQFGDETTNELVNWLNAVDTEFRNELRDQDDRNWERFRAELARSIAELRTELKAEIAAIRTDVHTELRFQFRWMFTFWVTTMLALLGLRLL